MRNQPTSYRVFVIDDGNESCPLLWEHESSPSLAAFPGGRLRKVGSFSTRAEAWKVFAGVLEEQFG